MRIALFTDTYSPEINGVVTSVDTYLKELERRGHDVTVFAPRYGGVESTDPRIVRCPSIPFPFKMMKERRLPLIRLRDLLRFGRRRIDVIHSQVPGTMGVCALLVSALWRVPHVHTYHTNYMEYVHYAPFYRSFSRRAVLWIARHYCGRCTHLISPSEGMRKELLGYKIGRPITVIPTGVSFSSADTGASLDALLKRYSIELPEYVRSRHLLVSVGRLGREKNHPFLIDALRRMTERGIDAHLFLIGQGPDQPIVDRAIRKHGLEDRITLTGYMTRPDVLAFVRHCDLFVFASKTETQGLAVLEAMSVGTPVVAILATGVEDLIADGTGGIATSDDPEEFARSVIDVLSDPQRRVTLEEDAIRRAHEWSVEAQAERLVAVYGDAVSEFRAHGLPRYGHPTRF